MRNPDWTLSCLLVLEWCVWHDRCPKQWRVCVSDHGLHDQAGTSCRVEPTPEGLREFPPGRELWRDESFGFYGLPAKLFLTHCESQSRTGQKTLGVKYYHHEDGRAAWFPEHYTGKQKTLVAEMCEWETISGIVETISLDVSYKLVLLPPEDALAAQSYLPTLPRSPGPDGIDFQILTIVQPCELGGPNSKIVDAICALEACCRRLLRQRNRLAKSSNLLTCRWVDSSKRMRIPSTRMKKELLCFSNVTNTPANAICVSCLPLTELTSSHRFPSSRYDVTMLLYQFSPFRENSCGHAANGAKEEGGQSVQPQSVRAFTRGYQLPRNHNYDRPCLSVLLRERDPLMLCIGQTIIHHTNYPAGLLERPSVGLQAEHSESQPTAYAAGGGMAAKIPAQHVSLLRNKFSSLDNLKKRVPLLPPPFLPVTKKSFQGLSLWALLMD
ncbi:uncharacterized protein MYCFIDRAFT_180697 [Pseudocercospora fijiensis CIRAD86]|uniref:Uncharacterized protein n=1 Tax=Pseudocercospora fijiensis (strain CIRAD86) TaxID=383855 RepID=M2ZCH0_PSEFD|nr:uncharacterized protein MYCFIDRAFT_180697 [Pseudocercospora fijiensis CIRAD86]EME76794.1 hypothetical protein MYCFIDRAFT_180697 [Pseudocercospora fijiensis CIRAD86]